MRLYIMSQIKKPLSSMLKGFFIFHRIAPNRILVEMAGVEPASASTTLENTTCLDIVYCFNTKRPDEQGTRRDPLSLVQSPEA